MALALKTPLDLGKLELQNPRMQNLSASPSSPVSGQFYYDTDDNTAYIWNGSAWVAMQGQTAAQILALLLTVDGSGSGLDADLLDGQSSAYYLSRANHTGTQTASTISDFDTQVRTSTLNQMTAPTADLSINSHKLTNVTDPTSAQDAATKNYVDGLLNGLDWKNSVRVATTAAGTLATSFENGDTIDGVVLATGNRILIKDQAAPAENGVYVVAASGAPTRATDCDASAEVTGGFTVFVNEGTSNADTAWSLTTNDTITLGTTGLTFTQISGLGQITAGAALTKSGNTLDVAVDNSSIEVSGDALRVKAAGVTDAMLASTFTKKSTGTIGDGASTSIAYTHSLGTRAVLVEVYDSSTFETVLCDVTRNSTSQVTLGFATAPASAAYTVVVIG